mmetsp:Transcript_43474/g.100087  ORF Transcript_43474/g.100087 Transcript_43474/m.100087 type:complete len:214 (+) Transcript_43474:148-789(+)
MVTVPPPHPLRTKFASPIFLKTKMCRFFLLGICERGRNCRFAHDKEELRQAPDFTCTRLCERLIASGTCTDPECKFAHNKEELRQKKPYPVGPINDSEVEGLEPGCSDQKDETWSRQSTMDCGSFAVQISDLTQASSASTVLEHYATCTVRQVSCEGHDVAEDVYPSASVRSSSDLKAHGLLFSVKHTFLHFEPAAAASLEPCAARKLRSRSV